MKVLVKAGFVGALLWLSLIIAMFIGYIMNLVGIIHTINEPITGLFIGRLVGVVAFPLGALLGYF
jgi:hypothetical protein